MFWYLMVLFDASVCYLCLLMIKFDDAFQECKYLWNIICCLETTTSRRKEMVNMTRQRFDCCCFYLMPIFCYILFLILLFRSVSLTFIVPMIEKWANKICTIIYILKIPRYSIRSKIWVLVTVCTYFWLTKIFFYRGIFDFRINFIWTQ